MAEVLMPKATAVWLCDNTTLTFQQIAEFVGLHELEVQAIADGEVAPGMQGLDPLVAGQLTIEEIRRCEADGAGKLDLAKSDIPRPDSRPRGARYTPVSKRQDKPDAIEWILRNYPEVQDASIGRLLGTTKPTINAIRDRTHWNSANLRPRSPVELGFCSISELEAIVVKARQAVARAEERARKKAGKSALEEVAVEAHPDAGMEEAGDTPAEATPATPNPNPYPFLPGGDTGSSS
ncbi:MAG: DUF1013 domain-containing protein [Proteobacteria bacterium]|nr:DUF1013 domain-containing protein [Pseudomonadota bacterium]MDA1356028.1 DUF1013 domain-containing protein [Pseudomonadota bacterium]